MSEQKVESSTEKGAVELTEDDLGKTSGGAAPRKMSSAEQGYFKTEITDIVVTS